MIEPTLTTSGGPLQLVFAADERFAMPLAVAMTSALDGLADTSRVNVLVIDGGLSQAAQSKLSDLLERHRRRLELVFHCRSAPTAVLPQLASYEFANSAFNLNNYLRLAIPFMLPDDARHAIYLDCDVVVRADLGRLRDLIPQDKATLAVRDYGAATLESRFEAERIPQVDLPTTGRHYFNSGVLAMNLERWRRDHVSENTKRLAETHPCLRRFADQDALNVALYDQWTEMDLAWNLQTGGPDRIRRVGASETEFLGEPYEQIRQRARIIHFTGNKPWDQGFTNPDRPAFVEALRRSGWFTPLEFRCWQVGWWAKLVKRQVGKRLGSSRPRVSQAHTETVNPTETT
jgi:lipopolysaccharide biosynthesis glycosyltransferase